MAKLDLKDAYFAIPIAKAQRKFLRFTYEGVTYEFNCLPFSLSSAPWADSEASNSSCQRTGCKIDCLHRRYSDSSRFRGSGKGQHTGTEISPGVPGLQNQPEKIDFQPHPNDRVSGAPGGLPNDGTLPPFGEDKPHLGRCSESSKTTEDLSKRPLQAGWEDECYNTNHSPSTTFLSPPPKGSCKLPESVQSGLQSNPISLLQQQEGADLVGLPDGSLEWEITDQEPGGCDHRIRCIPERMGCMSPWACQEASQHINCLELLAATLAVKCFLKNDRDLHILLRIDNMTAVSYIINHLGGTVSQDLIALTREFWMWCLERNIHLTAQHILNAIADWESRVLMDRSDWKLNPMIFQKISLLFGPIEVDLFASRLSTQCQRFFSWWPFAEATDAFLQSWSHLKGFANPPWCVIGRVLAQVKSQRAQFVLVAPVWKTQPWFPTLLWMLIDYLKLISRDQQILAPDQHQPHVGTLPQLAI